MSGLLCKHYVESRDYQGQNAVDKHKELGVGEVGTIVRLCHDPLLDEKKGEK